MRQIIKQPDGKFALWSSVCDNFILINASPEEIINYKIERKTESIKNNVMKTISKLKQNEKPYYQFTQTWEDCLETVKNNHGQKELNHLLKALKENILEV